MLNRQIGSILRGKATRLQVFLATVLGAMLGFVPGFFMPGDLGGGFAQAPGLILVLICVALIANANLAVFGGMTLLAKLLSLVLLPVSYTVGVWLVDGPFQSLVRWLCHSQVTAWFGLEHYATTGGLVVGLLIGVGAGFLLNKLLRAIRSRMANLEENSEKYQSYASRWWVRLLGWVFLGRGKGQKQTWREIADSRKLGLPIRILGVVAATLLLGAVFVFQQWFSTPILTSSMKSALEEGNGATVDLEQAALSLASGEIRVQAFAMADAAELTKNLLAADELVLKLDTAELMRRRLVIDEIRAVNARAGTRREAPAERFPAPATEPEPEPGPAGVPTIEEILAEYEVWEARLEQVRDWVETVFEPGEAPVPSTPEEIAKEREAQAEEGGLASVVAKHLLEDRPFLVIRKVDIEGITWTHGGVEEQLALRLRNVSSDPWLLAKPPELSFAAASESFAFSLAGPSSKDAGVGLKLSAKALAVDKVLSGLRLKGSNPVRGGTIDLDVGGMFSSLPGKAMTVDLPLAVTLRNTTLAFGGRETAIEQLAIPIGIEGSLTQPSIRLESGAFARALLDAGKQELANLVKQGAGKLIGELPSNLTKELEGVIDPNKSPEQMADAAKKKLEDEAKKLEGAAKDRAKKELEKGLEKVLPGGLGGLLGGKKRKQD
ncbi:MAG: hypothetical protein NXI31_03635 [bacterium]|nr:hypothetical protein [bacterium]